LRDRDQPWIELACDRARSAGAVGPIAGVREIERALASSFPTARVERAGRGETSAGGAPIVSVAAWRSPTYDPQALDAALAATSARGRLRIRVVLDEHPPSAAVIEILSRAQPYLDRRNDASSGARFDRVLAAHHALHDLAKPLVRADYAHAIDVWQWTLRLEPGASLAVQAAALFHDVERLVSEADQRVEQRALDYAAFKREHARRGAAIAERALIEAGLEVAAAARAAELVRAHEAPDGDPERALLNDADALSFFSLNSAGFMDYYGPEHTRTKVAYTLARLSPERRERLGAMRLRADVAALARELTNTARARQEVGP
jgi:hypothetical protein